MALSKITADSIAANAVTANSIGYTPANKAGDTFTGNVAIGSGTFNSTLDVTGAQFNANTVGGYSTASLRYNGAPAANSYGPGLTFSQYWYNASTSSITTGAIAGVKTQGDGNFGGGLAFFSGGLGASAVTERMRIDDAGRVTKPYQPSFYAYHSTSPTPTNSSLFTFDSTNYNSGMYSTSTGRMTAPVAGRYLVTAAFRVNNQNAGYYAQTLLFVNGASTWQGSYHNSTMSSGAAGYMAVIYTGILSLGQGDYVQPYWTVQGGTTQFSGLESWFSGHLLG